MKRLAGYIVASFGKDMDICLGRRVYGVALINASGLMHLETKEEQEICTLKLKISKA